VTRVGPTPEQVDAWVELAELGPGPGLRGERPAGGRTPGGRPGRRRPVRVAPRTDQQIRERVEAALAGGIDPASEQARLVLADLVGRYAQTFGKADTPEYRTKLLLRLQIANDVRVERY
jgi:hypothetical protein